MPTYCFQNNETGAVIEEQMRMSELDAFKEANPHLTLVHQPNQLVRDKGIKPDPGFRQLLKDIHRANRGSKINTW